MKKSISILTFTLLLLLVLSGCGKDKELPVVEIIEEEPVVIVDKPVEEEPVVEPVKEGLPSPISGIYAKEDIINQRIVGIMFDNHPGARWQAGLKDAEIVYEFPVEGTYTRYLGLYLINSPESIGPIRSSRPYFVTKILEFDGIYVHVGGSNEAMADIRTFKIGDIDGLSSSNKVFWRSSKKKIPHNLYSSMEVIRQTQVDRKFNLTGKYEGLKFNEDDIDIDGESAKVILLNYFKDNTTKYTYDEEAKVYTRQKDGKDHIDESDNSHIIAKNIIIQEVNTKVLDNEGRLQVDLVGEGKGKYFTNGKGVAINWKKDDRKNKTFYYDIEGEEISLNPGVTWIQVIKKDSIIATE